MSQAPDAVEHQPAPVNRARGARARRRRATRDRLARHPAVAGLVALLVPVLAACGDGNDEPQASDRLAVVATTMALQDFTRQVGGDRVVVTGLLGPQTEPHEYEPRPSDAEAVSEAQVVVANGAGLDDWLDDLLANAGAQAARVDATEGIELLPGEDAGEGDPHVWHDPERAKLMVARVAAGLSAADPAGGATYRRNAAAYSRELDAMAAQIRRQFATVAPERRRLVTSHDAFSYFAHAYDVELVGSVLASVSTDAEPSARALRELVEDIRRAGVTTVFTEEAVDPKLERQVAQEAGAEVSTSLYADVLGAPGSGAETFIDAELANARAMLAAWR